MCRPDDYPPFECRGCGHLSHIARCPGSPSHSPAAADCRCKGSPYVIEEVDDAAGRILRQLAAAATTATAAGLDGRALAFERAREEIIREVAPLDHSDCDHGCVFGDPCCPVMPAGRPAAVAQSDYCGNLR